MPSYIRGDDNFDSQVIFAGGTSGQVLTSNGSGSAPSWGAASGTLKLLAYEELTTTATAYTYTGLAGYDQLIVSFAFSQPSTSYGHSFEVRTSGGTWRTCGEIGVPAGNQDSVYGSVRICNFGKASGPMTTLVGNGHDSTSNLSNLAGSSTLTSQLLTIAGFTANDPTELDEFRITSGTAFGAYNGKSGYITIWGIAL
jgi:hypothetical protein